MMIMLSEVWKILYVIGMVLGIGFCAACVLMCVLIGVMVIRACVDYGDEMQARQVREEKESEEGYVNDESVEKWPDGEECKLGVSGIGEENSWLVRENGD